MHESISRTGTAHGRHVSPHLFRHSIARHLKSAGYASEFMQKFLGHQSITTAMDTYGTLSLGEMQEMITNKMGDKSLTQGRNNMGELQSK